MKATQTKAASAKLEYAVSQIGHRLLNLKIHWLSKEKARHIPAMLSVSKQIYTMVLIIWLKLRAKPDKQRLRTPSNKH